MYHNVAAVPAMILGLLGVLAGCAAEPSAQQESPTAQETAEQPRSDQPAHQSRSEMVVVPDLMGMALPDATAALDKAGLENKPTDAVEDRGIWDRGNWYVVSQTPKAGADVAVGSTVELGVRNVRDGEAEPNGELADIAVPNVVGMNLVDSLRKLEKVGLRVSPRDLHPDYADRLVIVYSNWYTLAQCTPHGDTAQPGDEITVGVVKVDELTPELRAAANNESLSDALSC